MRRPVRPAPPAHRHVSLKFLAFIIPYRSNSAF
jgi:hypothetical protein